MQKIKRVTEAELKELLAVAVEKREYRPTAIAVVRNSHDKILLILPVNEEAAAFHLPQGGIEDGENPTEAMLRELVEELEVSEEFYSDPRLLGVAELDAESGRVDKRGFTRGKLYIGIGFRCTAPRSAFVPTKEVRAGCWVEPKQADQALALTRPEKREIILGFIEAAER